MMFDCDAIKIKKEGNEKTKKKMVFIYKINKLTSPYANSSAVEIFWAIEAAGITTRKLEALPFWLPGDCCLWLNWWAELLLKKKKINVKKY